MAGIQGGIQAPPSRMEGKASYSNRVTVADVELSEMVDIERELGEAIAAVAEGEAKHNLRRIQQRLVILSSSLRLRASSPLKSHGAEALSVKNLTSKALSSRSVSPPSLPPHASTVSPEISSPPHVSPALESDKRHADDARVKPRALMSFTPRHLTPTAAVGADGHVHHSRALYQRSTDGFRGLSRRTVGSLRTDLTSRKLMLSVSPAHLARMSPAHLPNATRFFEKFKLPSTATGSDLTGIVVDTDEQKQSEARSLVSRSPNPCAGTVSHATSLSADSCHNDGHTHEHNTAADKEERGNVREAERREQPWHPVERGEATGTTVSSTTAASPPSRAPPVSPPVPRLQIPGPEFKEPWDAAAVAEAGGYQSGNFADAYEWLSQVPQGVLAHLKVFSDSQVTSQTRTMHTHNTSPRASPGSSSRDPDTALSWSGNIGDLVRLVGLEEEEAIYNGRCGQVVAKLDPAQGRQIEDDKELQEWKDAAEFVVRLFGNEELVSLAHQHLTAAAAGQSPLEVVLSDSQSCAPTNVTDMSTERETAAEDDSLSASAASAATAPPPLFNASHLARPCTREQGPREGVASSSAEAPNLARPDRSFSRQRLPWAGCGATQSPEVAIASKTKCTAMITPEPQGLRLAAHPTPTEVLQEQSPVTVQSLFLPRPPTNKSLRVEAPVSQAGQSMADPKFSAMLKARRRSERGLDRLHEGHVSESWRIGDLPFCARACVRA